MGEDPRGRNEKWMGIGLLGRGGGEINQGGDDGAGVWSGGKKMCGCLFL
jgi:hypothetical protein